MGSNKEALRKPILSIHVAHTSKSVWVGFLSDISPELLNKLQMSLYDDEEEEEVLAELYLGTDEDLRQALASGSHPGRFLQENCEEVFIGDYVPMKLNESKAA